MEIIVEDGTNVPGANSYVSLLELQDYALARDITLPDKEEDQTVLLVKAMDYLNTFNRRWVGYPTFDDQALAWPRTHIWKELGVPSDLKTAQMAAAVAAMTVELLPIQSGTQRLASRKTVGPITVQYQNTSSSYGIPALPQVRSLLAGLLAGGAGQIPVVRA